MTFKDTSSDQSMLWSEGFPASPTPSPASDSARPTSGTCGPSTHGSSDPSDPVGSLLRMSLVCALPPQMRSLVTWKKRDTPAGRPWWVLGRSGPRTGEIGCGSRLSWPSVNQFSDSPSANKRANWKALDGNNTLRQAAAWSDSKWPTPRASDGRGKGTSSGDSLPIVVKDWPTPLSADARGSAGVGKNELPNAVRNYAGPPAPASPSTNGKLRDWSTPLASDSLGEMHQSAKALAMGFAPRLQDQARETAAGTLNPAWVTQLMGFPDGWLDLPDETLSGLLATQSSPKSPKRSAGRSSK